MSKVSKKNTKFWDELRGVIRTRKGGRWVIGKGVTSHSYSMLDELAGNVSFFQVLIMHVTGVMPERRLAEWLEAIFICLSWPDPRMWPNFIGALCGTTKTSPVTGVCLGTLASDSQIYGPGTILDTARFIIYAMEKTSKGWSVEKVVETQPKQAGVKVRAPGYIRPFAKGDERVEPMQRISKELGFTIGPYLKLAYCIQDVLYERHGESINLAGYIVAFLLDQKFTPDQIYRVCSLCVSAGVQACYAEAADRPPETFLPLRCDDIEYCGKPEREVPFEKI